MQSTTHTTEQKIAARVDTLEQTVGALEGKLNVVVETVAVHDERLRDVQSEMKHYTTMAYQVTQHLTEHKQRQNLVFQGLGFALVGLLFWIVSRVT